MDTDRAGWLTGPVRFSKVTLQGFRNLSLVDLALTGRRARFWKSLDGEPQVIATGTSLPDTGGGWQVLQVANGSIIPQ